MRKLFLLSVSLAVLAGCHESDGAPAGRPPPPALAGTTGTLTVRSGSGAAGPFRIAALDRFAVEAGYQGVAGQHPARVDVFSPNGLLYLQLRGVFEAGADGKATFGDVVEVAGTPIEGFHQVGTWRFVLTVGEAPPLATAEALLVE